MVTDQPWSKAERRRINSKMLLGMVCEKVDQIDGYFSNTKNGKAERIWVSMKVKM